VLDHSLESLERSIISGPRVINTLSSGTEGQWAGPDGLSQSMFMYYPEPNRAGSHGTSGVRVVIVFVCRYVSLITCWSADVDAVGARLLFRGPRGVIRITREVIDKAGLNRLLDPYQ
jgi:hypothetical protein